MVPIGAALAYGGSVLGGNLRNWDDSKWRVECTPHFLWLSCGSICADTAVPNCAARLESQAGSLNQHPQYQQVWSGCKPDHASFRRQH